MAKVRYREISPELEKLATPLPSPTSRVSIGFEEEVGEFYYFPVHDLVPYKNQARTIFDDEEIKKLAETISQHGIRQPLTVIKSDIIQDKYEVVSGERRLRAAKAAGLNKVPCIVLKNPKDANEISLIENIQRQDLHPIELARALNTILENKPYGAKSEIGRKIGLSSSQITETLALLALHSDIQQEALNTSFRGRENFRKLLSLESLEAQREFIHSCTNHKEITNCGKSKKTISKSIIRISIVDGVLKVQNYSLNKISEKERQDIKQALENIIKQLDNASFRGREN